MLLLVLKVDDDLIKQQIPAADLAEPPTFVEAKSLRLQLAQQIPDFRIDFSGSDQCLQISVHREA